MTMVESEQNRTTEHYASYSQLTTHRACPQRWFYSSVKRLSKVDPDDVKVYLEVGNWWHSLRHADSIERGRAHGSLKWVPKDIQTVDEWPRWRTTVSHPKTTVLEMAELWWDTRTPYQVDQWRELLGWENLETALRYIDEEYHRQWAEDLEHERPLAVELSWRRVLPSVRQPPGGDLVDPDTVLIGYVDEVFFDVKRNLVVARDHKGHKSLSTQTVADDMMDSQLQLYAWGANSMVLDWGMGPIRATAYDRVCTTAPRPPQLTQSGRLAVRGGEPSIASADLRTYLEWAAGPDGEGVPYPGLKKDGSGAGMYVAEEGIIERLSNPKARSVWFQRTRTPLNANVVRTHLRAGADSAIDMMNSRARAEFSGEAARNLAGHCRWCDYVGLCRAQLIGGPDGEYELADFKLRVRE